MNKIYKSLASAVAIICLSLAIWSCENNVAPTIETTTLKGVLADKQGNTVPFAIVNIYDVSSGKTVIQTDKLLAKDTTDEDGNYEVKNIPVDFENLTLEAEHSDFAKFQIKLKNVKSEIKDNKLQSKMENKDECGFQLNFTILDSSSQQAISGAQVRLNRDGKLIRKTITNEQGNINFESVCPGKYEFRLAREGYKTIESTVTIGGSDSITNLPLLMMRSNQTPPDTCCDGILKLFVKDKDGKYLVGAKYKLVQNGKTIKDGSVTSDNEPVTLDKLCEGKYRLLITLDGYNAIEMDVTISCKEPTNISKVMEKPATDTCCDGIAKIFVKDKDGKYIIGAKFKLYLNGKVIKEGIITSDNEPFTLDKLCEGKYSISISADGYNSVETTLTVSCKEPVNVSKILEKKAVDSCCDGILKLFIKDKDGKYLIGAKYKLVQNGKTIKDGSVTSDNEPVTLDKLCEGKYRLLITLEGYNAIEMDVTISCKEPTNISKVMEKPSTDTCCDGIAKIFVKDKDGKYIIGAKFKLYLNGKVIKEGTITSDNEPFTLDKLCEGKYSISISADGYNSVETTLTVSCKEPVNVSKILEKKATDSCCDGVAKFYVKNAEGKIIVGAKIRVYKGSTLIKEATVSSSTEPYTLSGLCEGDGYSVSFSADGYNGVETSFIVSCKEPVTVSKQLTSTQQSDSCCTATLKFKVMDKATSQWISGATVKIMIDNIVVQTGTTNNDGYWISSQLCTANYKIIITKDGYNDLNLSWLVKAPCSNLSETFKMEK